MCNNVFGFYRVIFLWLKHAIQNILQNIFMFLLSHVFVIKTCNTKYTAKGFCDFIVLCFLWLKQAIQNMMQMALANCVEQVIYIVGLYAHNNLRLADKLVDIRPIYSEKSLKWDEIVNSDLLRIAVDLQLNADVLIRFLC